jgi:hypothetical protein
MSTAAPLSSTPPERPIACGEEPDAGFQQRWDAWLARGRAHERRARQRLLVVAIAIGAAVLAALLAHGPFFS